MKNKYYNVPKMNLGGAISGAASGAGAGAEFGPWGAVAGGAIGAISSVMNAKKQKQLMEEEKRRQEALARNQALQSSAANQSMFPNKGVTTNIDPFSFAMFGSKLPYKAMAGGNLQQVNSDTGLAIGQSHEGPNGGITIADQQNQPVASVEQAPNGNPEIIKDNIVVSGRFNELHNTAMNLVKNQSKLEKKNKLYNNPGVKKYIDSMFNKIEQQQQSLREQMGEGQPQAMYGGKFAGGGTIDPNAAPVNDGRSGKGFMSLMNDVINAPSRTKVGLDKTSALYKAPIETSTPFNPNIKEKSYRINGATYIQDSQVDPANMSDNHEFVQWDNPDIEKYAQKNAVTAKGMDAAIRSKDDMVNYVNKGRGKFVENATIPLEMLSTLTPQGRIASLGFSTAKDLGKGNYGNAALNLALGLTPFGKIPDFAAKTSKVLNVAKQNHHAINEYAPYMGTVPHAIEAITGKKEGKTKAHAYGGQLRKMEEGGDLSGILGPLASTVGGFLNDKKLGGIGQRTGVPMMQAQKVYTDLNPYLQQQNTINKSLNNSISSSTGKVAGMLQNQINTNRGIGEAALANKNMNSQLQQQAQQANLQQANTNANIANQAAQESAQLNNAVVDRGNDRMSNMYNQMQVGAQDRNAKKADMMRFNVASKAFDKDTQAELQQNMQDIYGGNGGGLIGKIGDWVGNISKNKTKDYSSIPSQNQIGPLAPETSDPLNPDMLGITKSLLPKAFNKYGGYIKRKKRA